MIEKFPIGRYWKTASDLKPSGEAVVGQGLSPRVQGHEDGSNGVEGDEQALQFFQL